MKKLLKAVVIAVLLLALLPIYALAANNGPMDPEDLGDGFAWDVAFISVYNPAKSGEKISIFAEHKTNNKAIKGATYDLKTNTLTLKNFNQPKKGISVNAMGEDFKLKLVGKNKVGTLTIWGYGWGGNIQITGSGSIEINKKKIVDNAINLKAEGSNAVFKVDKTATVKLWAKTNLFNTKMTTTNSDTKAIVLSNGQNVTVKKAQSYLEDKESVAFRLDEGNYGSSYPVYKDSKGTKYVIWDFYNEVPTEIYKLGSKGSDGYYTGTKASVSYSSLTQSIIKTKMKGCYDYVVKGKSLTIPAGSSATTSIKKLTAKSKGFTIKWTKKSVKGYEIQYSTSSKFSNATTKTIKKSSTVSKTINNLKSKKKYYVRIRTYKTVKGQKLYSAWTKAQNIKTK